MDKILSGVKKILFIISNLETGGVSKALTSLINVMDRKAYDVSLMIISPRGAFMTLLPKDLRLITNPIWSDLTSGISGITNLLKRGHPVLAIGHLLRLVTSTFNKAWAGRLITKLSPALEEEFDTVVDFNGQQQLYYMVDKIKAKKKLTFFHSDYKKWPYYKSADKKYFPKVDRIFTVSEECVQSLKEVFPEVKVKISLMENIVSPKVLFPMSDEVITEMDDSISSILTIGHVCENKGSHWAIEAASILKSKGITFKWYFLGSCDNVAKYEKLARENGVDDLVMFLGIRTNPYPYIRKASIICHPSQFEGKSIALDEAKLFSKPVVVTNFSTVSDQFRHEENALICKMTPQSIAENIERLLKDKALQKKFELTLKKELRDNSDQIYKLYDIFDA